MVFCYGSSNSLRQEQSKEHKSQFEEVLLGQIRGDLSIKINNDNSGLQPTGKMKSCVHSDINKQGEKTLFLIAEYRPRQGMMASETSMDARTSEQNQAEQQDIYIVSNHLPTNCLLVTKRKIVALQ